MAWHADVQIDPGGDGDLLSLDAFEAAYGGEDLTETDGVRGRVVGTPNDGPIVYWAGWQAGMTEAIRIVIEAETDPDLSPDGINDAAGDDALITSRQYMHETTQPFCIEFNSLEFDPGSYDILAWTPDNASSVCKVTKCVLRDLSGSYSAIVVEAAGAGTLYVGGCLFKEITGTGEAGINIVGAHTVKVVNCTFAGCNSAVIDAGATVTVKNCAAVNELEGDWSNVDVETTCLSELDTTLTDDDADDFTEPTAEDYTVYDTNSALYQAGTTESDSWFTTLCATDFAGTTWGGTPAVGCFELAGSAGYSHDLGGVTAGNIGSVGGIDSGDIDKIGGV